MESLSPCLNCHSGKNREICCEKCDDLKKYQDYLDQIMPLQINLTCSPILEDCPLLLDQKAELTKNDFQAFLFYSNKILLEE